jgi:hypothetical protein
LYAAHHEGKKYAGLDIEVKYLSSSIIAKNNSLLVS